MGVDPKSKGWEEMAEEAVEAKTDVAVKAAEKTVDTTEDDIDGCASCSKCCGKTE